MLPIRPFAPFRRAVLAAIFLVWTLMAGAALADDLVGFYFDADQGTDEVIVTEPNTILDGYLIMLDPSTDAGIAGWELRIDESISDVVTYLSWELSGQALNVMDPPHFVVGLGTPLPSETPLVLASCQILVTQVLPVEISLNPLYNNQSIPGEMAYLTGDDPGILLPLNTVTGNPEVAWINREQPIGIVDPPVLSFGEVPLSQSLTRVVEVSNVGGGILNLNITLPSDCEGFSLLPARFPQSIPPGGSLEIPVTFTPQALGLHECVLQLGSPHVNDVPINGIGREPVISWTLSGDPDFGEVAVGETVVGSLNIINDGEAPFVMDPVFLGGCEAFVIQNPGPTTVPVGQFRTLHVAFTPQDEVDYQCLIDLGGDLGGFEVVGRGRLPVAGYSISPNPLVFPTLVAPANHTALIQLQNTGEVVFDMDVALADGDDPFYISSGGGPSSLEPGESLLIGIRVITDISGSFANTLVFNNQHLPEVSIIAHVQEPNPSCLVTPEIIDFGEVPQGQVAVRYATVRNTGNTMLLIEAQPSCPEFQVTPEMVSLAPGASRSFALNFHAVELGPWECLISFGESLCTPVTCHGEVIEGVGPDENLVGLYFDEAFNENEIFLDNLGQLVPTYLVLKNPSTDTGVAAWECRLNISNPMTFLVGIHLQGGEAINVLTPPEFVVGLGTPLPWSPEIHLATFDLLVMDGVNETFLELHPVWQPSVPGAMAYLSGDPDPEIIPMSPITGMPLVAMINVGIVAVDAPAPQLSMDGGRVNLNWQTSQPEDVGYTIYRRGETGTPVLLNEHPVQASGGEVSFTDTPTGFTSGTVLHYSYGVVRDGNEVLRSGETEIVLTGMPMALTRLLPNVPNPFNPQTEVRFEMAEPGQARVSVYDVSGRLVQVLADEAWSSGEHAVTWQGRDTFGRRMPSGTYYLRMETVNGVDHRKIMLLK